MQLNSLSTLAILALAGVAFQAATAVPMDKSAMPPTSPERKAELEKLGQLTFGKPKVGKPEAQQPPNARQQQLQQLGRLTFGKPKVGKPEAQQPPSARQQPNTPEPFVAQQLASTEEQQGAIAAAESTHQQATGVQQASSSQEQVSSDMDAAQDDTAATQPDNQDTTDAVTPPQPTDALSNSEPSTAAEQPGPLDLCLAREWKAFLESDTVQQLKADVVAAKEQYDQAVERQDWAAKKEAMRRNDAADAALLDALVANAGWTECLKEVSPSATIKECPHREYQIAGNNNEYTAPTGPFWYWALKMAQDTFGSHARERTFASLLCQLAENDAFYWAEQLAKEATGYFRGVGLHALIHVVQLTEDKRTAKQVHAILQRVSAPRGSIQLRGYYDPVVEHYLFTHNPALLPMADLDSLQLSGGILARGLAISKRPLPYLAPWYKADEPTEPDMPHVQLPVADGKTIMRYVGESVDRPSKTVQYPIPDKRTFPVIEHPGPGDAYQFLTLPDESVAMPEQYSGVRLPYKGTEKDAHPFDLVVGYYKADEATSFYNAAYEDTYYPAAIVMAVRSTEGTKLLEHVFAHQVGKPGTNFLELPHVVSYMRELYGEGDGWRESEAWGRLGEAVMDCSKVCSKDQWPAFKKLMVERLSTLTPAQMKSFEYSVLFSGASELLKENPEVTELPDDQCTTFEQRGKCAAHRVASLLRQGKSATQAK